mmetsp:Transcript_40989/g.104838  ORF Transcript_40989/g.104838 Transcript_40989/m.104838 type:complete len:110 (+) Transcript_40989:1304-1633(+)
MRLAAELHLRSGNHTAEGLAPLSSYMYEMMMLKYKHDPGDKPLRFLIISEDKGAVAKLTEMAAPAFQRMAACDVLAPICCTHDARTVCLLIVYLCVRQGTSLCRGPARE